MIHRISAGSMTQPHLYQMIQEGIRELRGLGLSLRELGLHGHLVVGCDAAGMIARSREFRDAAGISPFHWLPPFEALTKLGCPSTMYGWPLVLNEAQPWGEVDMVCRDARVILRVE